MRIVTMIFPSSCFLYRAFILSQHPQMSHYPDSYNSDTQRALALVEAADAYLVATPVYRGTYTGALKNFFDLVPNDPKGSDPLRGKVVGLLATGGSDHHYLVLEHQLRPLFGFFGAYTPA